MKKLTYRDFVNTLCLTYARPGKFKVNGIDMSISWGELDYSSPLITFRKKDTKDNFIIKFEVLIQDTGTVLKRITLKGSTIKYIKTKGKEPEWGEVDADTPIGLGIDSDYTEPMVSLLMLAFIQRYIKEDETEE